MNEDFVSYDLAVKLKEKGFKELCLAYYYQDTEFYYNTCFGADVADGCKSFNSRPHLICGKRIDAPTISQVLKWLRDEKKIHICISYSDNLGLPWDYEVVLLDSAMYQNSESDFLSYEDAAIAGIEYVLDNLI